MKRTCGGCRALDGEHCSLGYKTDTINPIKQFNGLIIEIKPLEECPKPKTYDEYRKLHSERRGGNENGRRTTHKIAMED